MVRVCALVVGVLLAAGTWAADFGGKYEGSLNEEKVSLTLKQSGTSLTGDVEIAPAGGGDKLAATVSGTVSGDKAAGKMTVTQFGFALHFEANLTPTGIKMKIAEEGDDGKPDWAEADTVEMKRVSGGTQAPEEKKSAGLAAKFQKAPSAVLSGGKEYVHASGGKFRYPAGWTVKEIEGALQLLPGDAAADEAYFVVGDSANGMTDPASSQVVSAVDQQVVELLPFVKRVGTVEKTTAGGGPGAIVQWTGKAPNGKDILVRAHLTIMKGNGVALVAIGTKPLLDKRNDLLRQIFATFGWGQGKIDSQLVGNWKHWSYSGTSGYGRETSARVVLGADGKFTYQSDTETSMSAQGTNSLGEVQWTGGMNSRRGSGWQGTWTADGKNLILHFDDGSAETFTYSWKQEGANVFLIVTEAGGGKPTEWSRG